MQKAVGKKQKLGKQPQAKQRLGKQKAEMRTTDYGTKAEKLKPEMLKEAKGTTGLRDYGPRTADLVEKLKS